MEISEIHKLFLKCNSISIDTRTIEKNTMFVAIKGENFDANTFAEEALKKGSSYVIIENIDYYIDSRTIIVDDSLKLLQELSKFHRKYLNIPILAITGSNGKTTTKELVHKVLLKKFNCKATIGNLNNHIGVPLTLLSFNKDTEFGIVEMGANHKKEIEFLCSIANPDFGYITNFGKAHLEGFGGYEGVIIGKSELYNYLEENKKIAFINLDDTLQEKKTQNIKRISFSNFEMSADLFINKLEANPNVTVYYNSVVINSNLIGLYNSSNIQFAIIIGKYFNIFDSEIKSAIEEYYPDNNRSQIIKTEFNNIILDAYNANPSSMTLSIQNFLNIEKENKYLIVGDMYELGIETDYEHQNIINLLENESNIECLFVGKYFFKNRIKKEKRYFFEEFEDLYNHIITLKLKNKSIFIKGSRGMKLERILNII